MAKDVTGKIFKATVTSVGTAIVDNVVDSVKTISIQAFSGATSVNHLYNGRILQLSKEHGWLQTLDLYRFPNSYFNSDRAGIAVDSMQHHRLPTTIMGNGPETEDITWKYAPGNEWIWYYEDRSQTGFDQMPDSIIVRHDSVVSFKLLQPNQGLATIKSIRFNGYHRWFPGSASNPNPGYDDSSRVIIYTHVDTVRSVASSPFRYIECGGSRLNYQTSLTRGRYFVEPYDSTHFLITWSNLANYILGYQNGCLRLGPDISAPDDRSRFDTYMPGFGQTAMFSMDVADHLWFKQDYWHYSYIKTGNASMGTKTNVAKLGVQQKEEGSSFSIYPNPANDYVALASSLQGQVFQVRMMNVTGQESYRQSFTAGSFVVPTKDLVAGMYFLEVSTTNRKQTFKVVVQH
jgi:hypothetical protein